MKKLLCLLPLLVALAAYAGVPYVVNLNGVATNLSTYGALNSHGAFTGSLSSAFLSDLRVEGTLFLDGTVTGTGGGWPGMNPTGGFLFDLLGNNVFDFNSTPTVHNGLTIATGSLTAGGGTFSGIVTFGAQALSTSPTTNGPADNELVTAGFVHGLFQNNTVYYITTNIDTGTNVGAGQPLYQFQSTLPGVGTRVYTTADFLTNNGYLGSVVTTNTFQSLQGSIAVDTYMAFTGGGSGSTLSVHPEIYYSYDKTNWFGDFTSTAEDIARSVTNIYQWTVQFPLVTSTNAAGFYVQRRFKVNAVTGSGTRTLTVFVGTNTFSGPNDASHVNMQSPNALVGSVFLSANQTFTGSNTFTQPITGNASGLTNVQCSAINYSTNNFAGPTNAISLTGCYRLYTASGNTAVTNVTGSIGNQATWSVLFITNSSGSTITNTTSIPGAFAMGPNTTNSLNIASGKIGIVSVFAYAQLFTNYATAVSQ